MSERKDYASKIAPMPAPPTIAQNNVANIESAKAAEEPGEYKAAKKKRKK